VDDHWFADRPARSLRQLESRAMSLPHLPFIIVVVAAVLIVVGRTGRRTRVAIGGFVLLAFAALLVLLGYQ
jgi:hypothetical protein